MIVDEKKNLINRSADHISLEYDLKKFKNNSKYSVQLRLESDSRILSQHRKDIHISLQEKYQCIEGLELTHLDKEDVLLKLNYKTKLSQIKVKIEKEGKQIGCASSNGEMNHVDIIIGEGDYLLNVYQYSSTQGWGQVESIFYNQK